MSSRFGSLDEFASVNGCSYLQGRNETIITLLADTGLRVSELVALDWDHVDLDVDRPELYLSGGLQKGTKRDAYLDLEDKTARQLRGYWNGAWKTTDAVFPEPAERPYEQNVSSAHG